MATPTAPSDTPTASVTGTTRSTARSLVIGFAWSAIMLVVLSFWIRGKYNMTGLAIVILVAAIVAVGLAAWEAFALWFKKETPEEKVGSLLNQQRILGYAMVAGGVGLVVLAAYLSIGKKGTGYGFLPDNLGESFGVFLFAMIALAAGYQLLQPGSASIGSPIAGLSEKLPLLKLLQVVLGVLAIGTFGYLFFNYRGESQYLNWLPELAALLATSMLCLGCLLWLNAGTLDEIGARLFVLVFGGSIGLILFCYAIIRAIAWRQDIFLGGIAAWQGENAWHFWLVVYLQFIALLLMFGSLNLARADVRANVTLRRVTYGYDTLVQALLLIEILAVLNVVVYALMPFTYDWTKSRGAYALSESSKNLVTNLKKETHVIVLMSLNDPVFKDVRNLMDNCKALSNKLQVDYISPDNEPQKYRILAEKFPKIQPDSPLAAFGASGRGILLVYGPIPQDEKTTTPYDFISERKLVEEDHSARRTGGKSKRIFKAEGEIMKSLKFLAQDQKRRKIYILQGDDEPDINNDELAERRSYRADLFRLGFSAFAEKLKNDNLEVFGLNFGKELLDEKNPKEGQKPQQTTIYVKEDADRKKDIPKDCETLIVSPVSKELSFEVVQAVTRYMEGGGRMLVLLDVVADSEYSKLKNTGLEPLLKEYGVEVTDGYALAVRAPLESNQAGVLIATAALKSEHVLARQFVGRAVVMKNSARVLKPSEAPGRFKAEPVLQTEFRQGRFALVEKDPRILRQDLNRYVLELDDKDLLRLKLSREPVTVGVAVTETAKEKPRLVVVGDTEFVTNVDLRNQSTQLINYSFAASALEWMAERESIGAKPKETSQFTLDPTVNTERMILVPAWLMFLALVNLGLGVWIVRRR